MKPALIMQDNGGLHNANLEATHTRFVRGGSWKRQRTIIVLPAGDTIATRVALSHWGLATPPNNPVIRIAAVGQEVGEAYSNAIDSILAHPELSQWEFLLTIEHDNMPPWDGLLKLLEHMESKEGKDYAAIGGLYFTMGPGGVPQIWGDPKDPLPNMRPQPPDPKGGLVPCLGTGMGFTLWRLGTFKDPKLRRPWFKTQKEGGIATQDLYAWQDLQKNGYRCAVACDVRVGHHDRDGSRGGIPDMVW